MNGLKMGFSIDSHALGEFHGNAEMMILTTYHTVSLKNGEDRG